MKITTVYDNYKFGKKLRTGWGFSALVETGDREILFDTGGDSEILLENMKSLGIDLDKIEGVFLSHFHGDHTGGLTGFLEKNSDVKVYLLESFPRKFKNKIKSYGTEIVEIYSPKKIQKGFYSTGELGTFTKEQSMIVKTKKGLVIITGCAHPGIVKIIKKSKEFVDDNIYLAVGGFHLRGFPRRRLKFIINTFKKSDVQKVSPSHCTGDRAIEAFRQEYGDNFIMDGVGKTIEI